MHRVVPSVWLAFVICLVCLDGVHGQAATSGTPTAPEETGAGEAARAAQSRFERVRVRWLPLDLGWGGSCDEVIGRLCYGDEEATEWYGAIEDSRIVSAREDLLALLGDAADRAPHDPWVLGQRVSYLGEAGRWREAAAVAGSCGRRGDAENRREMPAAWCSALQGLTHHALGRFVASERAYRRALSEMDPDDRGIWSDPEPLLGGEAQRWWKGLDAEARVRILPGIWALMDPLLLVPGNDLLTEYWSRRTVGRIRENARNPYGMRWGSDLEEMLLRYGWEVGWARTAPTVLTAPGASNAVGYHHPESRALVPRLAALSDPATASEADWVPERRRARSAYAPAYAPVLLPGTGRVAVFPRGNRVVVVGAYALPEDTTFHAAHEHPTRDSVAPPWRDRPTEAGLFLLPADDPSSGERSVRDVGSETGALLVEAPAGRWVVSLEVLSPKRRRAGRTRMGLDRPPLPADLFTVSDLLLVDGLVDEGASLETTAHRALARGRFRAGERVGVAWELFGLGYREETISYRLALERVDPGVLGRVARWLGLGDEGPSQALAWEEPAPARPGPAFRGVELELSPLPSGRYRIRLEVVSGGRAVVVREIPIELRP